ncbi:hypothetical protein [Shimia sp. Alg240-R146]|uniref:hypothetical protein n=1 Tax=Shimia sp. Alg240-R146 TaxID=2993449 RepID=UPI0022E93EAF|nr:hypothetical protein [Shimia sp. Alg240-R146]
MQALVKWRLNTLDSISEADGKGYGRLAIWSSDLDNEPSSLPNRMHKTLACLTLAPIAIWLMCAGIVTYLNEIHGCEISSMGPSPCFVLGVDIGSTASELEFLAGWGLILFFLPFSLLFGAIWLVYLIRALVVYLAARSRKKT